MAAARRPGNDRIDPQSIDFTRYARFNLIRFNLIRFGLHHLGMPELRSTYLYDRNPWFFGGPISPQILD